jgi:hypothetical protein
MATDYDQDGWDESLDQDRKAGRKSSGKKWSLLHKLSDAPIKVHFSYPEKPYVHPVNSKKLPFRVGKQHFIPFGGKRGKGTYLECGADIGEPCIVHAYKNPEAYGLQNVAPQDIDQQGARIYYAVGGWIEEWYHLVEYYKDENDTAKGTYHRREKCEGRGCQYCGENLPKVFGNKFYTTFSPGQWQHSIHDLNKQIENMFCKCGGSIYVPSFYCSGCQKVILDVALTCDACQSDGVEIHSDTNEAECPKCHARWSARYTDHDKILPATKERHKCECGANALPVPSRVCSTPDCAVDPYGVFDCQLTLRTTGADKERRMVIDDYKIQEPDPRLFDPQFQGGDALAVKIVESHKKPMDLEYLLRPMSAEEQAKEVKLANPFTASGRAAGAGVYPKFNRDQANAEPVAPVADEDVPY